MHKYDHKEIEKKWREKWEENGVYKVMEDPKKKKYYILDMFPYPSGAGLHVGHPKGYIATDVFARMKMMQGYSVLHPFGWDAFGLPAENYAIKNKLHPAAATRQNVARFKEQMEIFGMTYDWDREVDTTDPEFYKWTQWIFRQMWKRGLAYESFEPINWCPSCKTALANEDLEQGRCERCDSEIERKPLRQWVLRITDYADRLLRDLDTLPDWEESIKEIQKNWIGRTQGARIKFKVVQGVTGPSGESHGPTASFVDAQDDRMIEVYTTRPDTLFGATYLVVAPEHQVIKNLESLISNFEEVSHYIEEARHKSDLLRSDLQKEKTGVVLKGIRAVNPATGEEIPVWVADYVPIGYGTGAIMAVPAHDDRDFEFAKKYGLPYKKVILPPKLEVNPQPAVDLAAVYGSQAEMRIEALCWTGDGEMTGSGEYSGMDSEIARTKIVERLSEEGHGKRSVGYKIKDWVFSRQRYWGEPIPLVHCETCKNRKYKYVFVHGHEGSANKHFFPWLKIQLENAGHTVVAVDLPGPNKPDLALQAKHVIDSAGMDEDTVVLGHSLGGIVALKAVEQAGRKIAKIVLVDSFVKPEFNDRDADGLETASGWIFDYGKIKDEADEIIMIADRNYPVVKEEHVREMWNLLEAKLIIAEPEAGHFCGQKEPVILKNILPDGWSAIPESELPLELPEVESYEPSGTGESPLANISDWVEVKCPKCESAAKRETNTMPQWAGSSWYYLAYIMRGISDFKFPFSKYKAALDKWLPVDFYVGGAEHAARHLIYARFWHKFLYDIGVLSHAEPFMRLQNVGLILAQDGRKMSKRWGNVINPDEIIENYGADATRLYEMFMGPFSQSCAWNTKGLIGMRRFLEKIIKLSAKCKVQSEKFKDQNIGSIVNKTIKKVSEDIEGFKFNTAISQLMILANAMGEEDELATGHYATLIKLLAPFAPHISEQLWEEVIGGRETGSIFRSAWPEYDPALIRDDTFELVIQVNGRNRAVINVPADISEDEAYALAAGDERAAKWLEGKDLIKKIYVKGRLVNFVIK